jgi:hypothetical protein
MLPVGGSVGLTLPGRNSSLAFSANISVLYMTREEYLFSGSAGLAVLKRDSRFSPLFALRAGCAAEIEQKKSLFGPSLESTLSFGLFLAPSLKVSIEGVTRAAYFPENKTFTVTGGAGFGLGIAF